MEMKDLNSDRGDMESVKLDQNQKTFSGKQNNSQFDVNGSAGLMGSEQPRSEARSNLLEKDLEQDNDDDEGILIKMSQEDDEEDFMNPSDRISERVTEEQK